MAATCKAPCGRLDTGVNGAARFELAIGNVADLTATERPAAHQHLPVSAIRCHDRFGADTVMPERLLQHQKRVDSGLAARIHLLQRDDVGIGPQDQRHHLLQVEAPVVADRAVDVPRHHPNRPSPLAAQEALPYFDTAACRPATIAIQTAMSTTTMTISAVLGDVNNRMIWLPRSDMTTSPGSSPSVVPTR